MIESHEALGLLAMFFAVGARGWVTLVKPNGDSIDKFALQLAMLAGGLVMVVARWIFST